MYTSVFFAPCEIILSLWERLQKAVKSTQIVEWVGYINLEYVVFEMRIANDACDSDFCENATIFSISRWNVQNNQQYSKWGIWLRLFNNRTSKKKKTFLNTISMLMWKIQLRKNTELNAVSILYVYLRRAIQT